MSILDRKPAKYSTSDLFWEPSAAPTDGAVGDINTMKLDPSHLGMVQDMIIDTSGVLRNRGAFVSVTTDTFTGLHPYGVVQTSKGTGLVLMDSTGIQYFYGTANDNLTGFAKLTVQGGVGSANELTQSGVIVNWCFSKLPNESGAMICGQWGSPGIANALTTIWGGNTVTTSDTSTGTAASTRGTKAIVGVGTGWTSALAGTFLFINNILVGQVDSVTSTTALVLKKGAYSTVAANTPVFKCVRMVFNTVYKGRITTSTASAIVIGSNSKWLTSGPAGGGSAFLTGDLFRYTDGAYIGTISSIQNDTTLTLGASAAIALTNEEYYIVKSTPVLPSTPSTAAFFAPCVELFADRYWYGGINASDPGIIASPGIGVAQIFNGTNSIAFSKKKEPEFLDLDPSSGDIITLPSGSNSDNIRGLCATRGGLVVFRTYDTFLITGYSPETFRAIKIVDDGCFGNSSFRPYRDGVVWAGPRSMWYFNGTQVIDILNNKVNKFYQRSVSGSQQGNPPGLAISNDHIMFSYPHDTTTSRVWPYKNTTKTIAYPTLVINMLNGAVSFFTNLYVTGHLNPKPLTSTSKLSPVILSRTGPSWVNGGNGLLLDGNKIFIDSSTGSDNFDATAQVATFTSGAQIGPDTMFETVKLTLGNAARLKFWKMLMMNYSSDVAMQADIIGVNDTTLDFPNRSTGTQTVVTFPISSNVGILKRVKFLIRTPQLIVRVYQVNTTSATSQRFKLFWYAVGGKWMRWGRQQ